MLPEKLGFDKNKFPAFRPNQYEIALEVSKSDKFMNWIEAPTGVGKSIIGLATAKLKHIDKVAYLVSNKQLQDQIIEDFDIPMMKGRSNYPCLRYPDNFPEVNAEICTVRGGPAACPHVSKCPYRIAKKIALAAPVCILNYAFFISESNFAGEFSGRNLLILDECDTIEDQLLSFVSVNVSAKDIKQLKLKVPKSDTDVDEWKKWIKDAMKKVETEMNKLDVEHNIFLLKEFQHYDNLFKRMSNLTYELSVDPFGWVLEINEDKKKNKSIHFQPVKVNRYAHNFLWNHTEQAIGMSATIMGAKYMSADLGIKEEDTNLYSLPSPFPIENRIVEYKPIANVTWKTKNSAYPLLVSYINEIMEKHKKDNIILHAVSYDLAMYLKKNLNKKLHKIMTHTTNDRIEVLEKFKNSKKSLLISPSMERGVDLAGDSCRVVIVPKVPYLNLGSKQVKKRLHEYKDGSKWYARKTARSLVQMTGRATRSSDDWSVSYIIDEQFDKLYSLNKDILPAWWMESVKGL